MEEHEIKCNNCPKAIDVYEEFAFTWIQDNKTVFLCYECNNKAKEGKKEIECEKCNYLGYEGNHKVCGFLLHGGTTKYVRNGQIDEPCPLTLR